MDIQSLANEFADLCRDGQFDEAARRFWSDDVVSIEAMDGPMARCEGRAACEAKAQWWTENNEVHAIETDGPHVNGDQFALIFHMDYTPSDGERRQEDEVALYTVRDGLVVEERFFY